MWQDPSVWSCQTHRVLERHMTLKWLLLNTIFLAPLETQWLQCLKLYSCFLSPIASLFLSQDISICVLSMFSPLLLCQCNKHLFIRVLKLILILHLTHLPVQFQIFTASFIGLLSGNCLLSLLHLLILRLRMFVSYICFLPGIYLYVPDATTQVQILYHYGGLSQAVPGPSLPACKRGPWTWIPYWCAVFQSWIQYCRFSLQNWKQFSTRGPQNWM